MALTEAEELEMLELENEEALAASSMRDAVAAPPPNPDYEVMGRSQTAQAPSPAYVPPVIQPGPGLDISPTRALLTNEPTSGYAESFMRGVPAQMGAIVGGVAGGGLTAGLGSVPGAMAGAAAGESVRQMGSQMFAAATGKEYSQPGEIIGNVALQGTLGGVSQAGAVGVDKAIKYGTERLPSFIEHYFGPQSAITRYIQSRGAKTVLTGDNLSPDAPMNALENARGAIVGGRKAAGSAVGAAEDALIESGALSQPLDVSDIAAGLRQAVEKAGLIGKDAAALAPAQKKNLEYILGRLEGGLTGSEAVQIKRMLGELIDTTGGRIPEVGGKAAGLIRQTTGKLAERINTTHPKLGEANAAAQKVIAVYDRYRQFLGQMKDAAFDSGDDALQMVADEAALRRIRSALASNPKVPAAAVAEFDQAVAGAGQALESVFDATAANAFNAAKAGRGAPSNILLKGASSLGLTSPYMAGKLLIGAEAAAKASPVAVSYRVVAGAASPALSPVAQNYLSNRRIPQPDPAFQAIGGMRPAYP